MFELGTGVWGLIALGFFMATYKQVDQEKTVHGKHQQIPRSESTAELKTLAEPWRNWIELEATLEEVGSAL